MTSTSKYGDYYDIDTANIFGADAPLSASAVIDLANNARHLRDEATQYRVKWDSTVDATGTGSRRNAVMNTPAESTGHYTHMITHCFPWQSYHDDAFPKQPILQANVMGSYSQATFYIYMMPAGFGINAEQDEQRYQDGWGWRKTISMAANGSEDGWHTGFTYNRREGTATEQNRARTEWSAYSAFTVQQWEHNADATATYAVAVTIHLYRLSVYLFCGAKALVYLDGLSLREYSA